MSVARAVGAGQCGAGERRRIGGEHADVEAGAVEQVAERQHQPARQQQHVEEQRADGGDAEDAEQRRAGCRTRLSQAKRRRAHRI